MILKTIPKIREMIWGDRELGKLFGAKSEKPVGEVWLLSDHPLITTEVQTLSGKALHINSVLESFNLNIERFPILLKLISAKEWLSIQVHPDDSFARKIEKEPWGKTECWFFLKKSTIGLIPEKINPDELPLKPDKIKKRLKILHPQYGDFLYIPAGTMHAIGPESMLIEIQQSSDLTYRVYDWERGRDLHIEKAVLVSKNVNIDNLIYKNFESFRSQYFHIYRVSGTTKILSNSIIVMLSNGEINSHKTSKYETFLLLGKEITRIKGNALVIKPGQVWYSNSKR